MASEVVNILKTLADETRLRIVHLVDQCGPELCVCDMVAVLGLPQSTISRQLMRLRHVGLVQDSREGMWINYSMADFSDSATENLIKALRLCWKSDAVFAEDKLKFYKLHAANQIVRCKRGQELTRRELTGQDL